MPNCLTHEHSATLLAGIKSAFNDSYLRLPYLWGSFTPQSPLYSVACSQIVQVFFMFTFLPPHIFNTAFETDINYWPIYSYAHTFPPSSNTGQQVKTAESSETDSTQSSWDPWSGCQPPTGAVQHPSLAGQLPLIPSNTRQLLWRSTVLAARKSARRSADWAVTRRSADWAVRWGLSHWTGYKIFLVIILC